MASEDLGSDVDVDMEEDPSSDENDDDDDVSGEQDSEEAVDEDDGDGFIAEWPQTPQKERASLGDGLPPESSPLRSSPPDIRSDPPSIARNVTWTAPQSAFSQKNGDAEEPLMTPIEIDQNPNVDYPPKTADTARMFSSAVRPETIVHRVDQEPKPGNDSLETLSGGNFNDPSSSLLASNQRLSIHAQNSQTITSSNGVPASGQGSWSGTDRSSNATQKSSTQLSAHKIPAFPQAKPAGKNKAQLINAPQTLSSARHIVDFAMRPPPSRLVVPGHLDGADSDLPSEVTSVMAEQQLLHDLKASVCPVSDDTQAPATPDRLSNGRASQQNSPASSVATKRKRREAPEMSPNALREQKVSRFNFTQESPVSQNPAVEASKARQEFLKGRKKSKQPIEQHDEVASSPPRVGSAPEVIMGENEVQPGHENHEDGPEDSSLYGKFRRAYPSYTASVKHFETMCKNLAASCRKGQISCHPILWDDYIARSVSDYLLYCQQQVLAAEPQDPYEKYYNEQIEGSLHEKKVVTRAKLVEWLGPEALTYV